MFRPQAKTHHHEMKTPAQVKILENIDIVWCKTPVTRVYGSVMFDKKPMISQICDIMGSVNSLHFLVLTLGLMLKGMLKEK